MMTGAPPCMVSKSERLIRYPVTRITSLADSYVEDILHAAAKRTFKDIEHGGRILDGGLVKGKDVANA